MPTNDKIAAILESVAEAGRQLDAAFKADPTLLQRMTDEFHAERTAERQQAYQQRLRGEGPFAQRRCKRDPFARYTGVGTGLHLMR